MQGRTLLESRNSHNHKAIAPETLYSIHILPARGCQVRHEQKTCQPSCSELGSVSDRRLLIVMPACVNAPAKVNQKNISEGS